MSMWLKPVAKRVISFTEGQASMTWREMTGLSRMTISLSPMWEISSSGAVAG